MCVNLSLPVHPTPPFPLWYPYIFFSITDFIFYKLKVCGNPRLNKFCRCGFSKRIGSFMSLCCIFVILSTFQTFTLLYYLLR